MSETIQHKMADKHNSLVRASSDASETTSSRPPMRHRKSWDGGNIAVVKGELQVSPRKKVENGPVSPRGPIKPVALSRPETDTVHEEDEDEENPASPQSASPREDVQNEIPEGIPEPEKQREIIEAIESECTCTYAVAKVWWRTWEEYVGISKLSPRQAPKPGESSPPGLIEMDTNNDGNNDYIAEDVWRHLVRWYGLSPAHQLDRKHLYFKDEKMFDICMLSPFSGIVEHQVKKFNRFEEIGYIECQLRRIFHIEDHKKSRLWISEKAQVPRFRQLLLRFRMLNDCIHRDKVYILALEECKGHTTWPTGEPGEPKGDLHKYADLMDGPKSSDYWAQKIEESLDTFAESVTQSLKESTRAFLQHGQALMNEKENELDTSRKTLESKLETTRVKETFLAQKSKELNGQEDRLTSERQSLEHDIADFRGKEEAFHEEQAKMIALHKVTDSKIKLDVGGTIFTTSLATLQKIPDTMLAAMFSGRHELTKEADGSYFLDRDGTFFRFILNFLRDGYVDKHTLPSDPGQIQEILREAKFYQVEGLITFLEGQLKEKEK